MRNIFEQTQGFHSVSQTQFDMLILTKNTVLTDILWTYFDCAGNASST